MKILLSGLNEQASQASVGIHCDNACSIEWKSASLFIAEAERFTGKPGRKWVWLYRAPWAWLAEGDSANALAALQQWQAEQHAVLQLRRNLRQDLILVNVDRVAAVPPAECFGLSFHTEQPSTAATPLVLTLANLLEQLAPEYWTLYEALEAAAWLPEGEPEFRSNRVLPPEEGLGELLELIHAGRQLPTANQQLAAYNEALRYASEELSGTQKRADNAQNNASTQFPEREPVLLQAMDKTFISEQSLKEGGKLLLIQLQQVQEVLEKQYLDNSTLREQLATLEQELAQALVGQQRLIKELEAARAIEIKAGQMREQSAEQGALLQTETVSIRTHLQIREENELLLAQLHQVQEELEKYYLANREILTTMSQSEHTIHRARVLLSRLTIHA